MLFKILNTTIELIENFFWADKLSIRVKKKSKTGKMAILFIVTTMSLFGRGDCMGFCGGGNWSLERNTDYTKLRKELKFLLSV